MQNEFQKQVLKIIEERGYTLRENLSALFGDTVKTGETNAVIWPAWREFPPEKIANVIVELRKIIPIHEESMDWTGDGEEYSPPDPGLLKKYADVISAIEHLDGLLSDFSEDDKKCNPVLLQDSVIGDIGMGLNLPLSLSSAGYELKELQSTLARTKLFFEVAKHGRRWRLPYHKSKTEIYKGLKMEAARRIAEIQEVVLGKPLGKVAAAIATILVVPGVGDVDPDALSVKICRKKS